MAKAAMGFHNPAQEPGFAKTFYKAFIISRVRANNLLPKGHQTKPPSRLNEASLVKALEEKGIGRPSTYASIIYNILSRGYIFKKGSALVPTFTAFVVISLLEEHLTWLVDYGFTARMETVLDNIACGEDQQISCLTRFYSGNEGLLKI